MKKYYILQMRRRKRKDRYMPNIEDGVISVFSSPKKAIQWIKKDGQRWAKDGSFKKDNFWAIMTVEIDSDHCDLYNFYNSKGEII